MPHNNRLQGGYFDLGPQVVLRATNNAVGYVEADFTLRGLAEARSGSSLNVLSLNVTNAGQIAIRSGARADFGKAAVTQKIWNEGGSMSLASNGAVYFNHFIDLVGGTLEGDGQFSMNNWMLWRGTGTPAILRDARLLIHGGSVNYYQEGRLRLERGTLRVGNPGGYGTTGTYLNSSGGTAVVEGNGRMEFFYQYPSGGSFLTGSWQFAPGVTLEFDAYESVNISARVQNQGTMRVLRGFHLSAGAAFTNAAEGRLTGTGTISVSGGALHNQGILAPGAPQGALTISGPVSQSPSSRLEIELAGTATSAYDRLNVSAGFPLPATLAVSLMNGFQPALNSQFVIVQGGSFTGAFQSQLLPTPGPGLRFTNELSASQIILRVVQSTNPAVAYTNWAAPLPPGLQDAEDDGDGDGLVNAVEFALGTDPQIPTTDHLVGEMVASAGERFPALVFNRSMTAAGVRLLLDSADNLESPQWQPIGFALELVADVDAARERIRLRDLRPLPDGARRFLRLKIELTL